MQTLEKPIGMIGRAAEGSMQFLGSITPKRPTRRQRMMGKIKRMRTPILILGTAGGIAGFLRSRKQSGDRTTERRLG
jgi:hypothetical protein